MKKGVRYVYLAAATVMMLFSGIIYAWSILKMPYLTEFGWSQGELGLNFTITMWCFCFGGIIGGALVKKLPLWAIIGLSAILALVGFWLSGSLSGEAAWQLYAAYGVLCGLGIGIAYNVVISTVMGWFPDKRATVSGVLMMGFGASSLVLGSVTDVLMNSLGWRNVYHGLGVCIFVIFAVCAVLIKPPAPLEREAADSNEITGEKAEYTTAEMVRRSTFWRFYAFQVLLVSIGSCVISFAKDISLSVGASESFAILMVGALSVCNGLGRILSGALFDKIGSVKTIRLAGALGILATLLMLLASIASSVPVWTTGVVFAGLSYGFMPPLSSGFVGKVYGRKNFASNFSIANTMLLFASFSGTIGGALFGMTGGYTSVFIFLIVFAVLGSIFGESLRKVNTAR